MPVVAEVLATALGRVTTVSISQGLSHLPTSPPAFTFGSVNLTRNGRG